MPDTTAETESPVFPCCKHCEDGPARQPCGIPHDNGCETCQDPA
jgi:hypothetical protein